jgi:hypothetical protein
MRESFTRRNILGLGLGSAILGACSRVATSAGTPTVICKQEGNRVPALKQLNNYGDEMESLLLLRSSPIAVKMLKSEADIPQPDLYKKRFEAWGMEHSK